jgi:hypothetical protein
VYVDAPAVLETLLDAARAATPEGELVLEEGAVFVDDVNDWVTTAGASSGMANEVPPGHVAVTAYVRLTDVPRDLWLSSSSAPAADAAVPADREDPSDIENLLLQLRLLVPRDGVYLPTTRDAFEAFATEYEAALGWGVAGHSYRYLPAALALRLPHPGGESDEMHIKMKSVTHCGGTDTTSVLAGADGGSKVIRHDDGEGQKSGSVFAHTDAIVATALSMRLGRRSSGTGTEASEVGKDETTTECESEDSDALRAGPSSGPDAPVVTPPLRAAAIASKNSQSPPSPSAAAGTSSIPLADGGFGGDTPAMASLISPADIPDAIAALIDEQHSAHHSHTGSTRGADGDSSTMSRAKRLAEVAMRRVNDLAWVHDQSSSSASHERQDSNASGSFECVGHSSNVVPRGRRCSTRGAEATSRHSTEPRWLPAMPAAVPLGWYLATTRDLRPAAAAEVEEAAGLETGTPVKARGHRAGVMAAQRELTDRGPSPLTEELPLTSGGGPPPPVEEEDAATRTARVAEAAAFVVWARQDNWYSISTMLRLYHEFAALDTDRNGLLMTHELAAMRDGCLAPYAAERIIQTYAQDAVALEYGRFLDLVLALEYPELPTAWRYWWGLLCTTTSGDATMSHAELYMACVDICDAARAAGLIDLKAATVFTEVRDLLRLPQAPLPEVLAASSRHALFGADLSSTLTTTTVSFADVARSGAAATVLPLLFDMAALIRYEEREQLMQRAAAAASAAQAAASPPPAGGM